MSESNYARLRRAVLAYAEALARYALLGNAWLDAAPELDELWAAVLDAAAPEPED